MSVIKTYPIFTGSNYIGAGDLFEPLYIETTDYGGMILHAIVRDANLCNVSYDVFTVSPFVETEVMRKSEYITTIKKEFNVYHFFYRRMG